ncbi:polysaccharide deacetylase family protein [Rhodococcus koreensis]
MDRRLFLTLLATGAAAVLVGCAPTDGTVVPGAPITSASTPFPATAAAAYEAWTIRRPALRRLVDSGQIQLANHTCDHPDPTILPRSAVAEQLPRCQKFLCDNYGVDAAPYYRAPRASTTPPSTRSRPTSDTPSPPSGTAHCRIRRSSPSDTSSTAPAHTSPRRRS